MGIKMSSLLHLATEEVIHVKIAYFKFHILVHSLSFIFLFIVGKNQVTSLDSANGHEFQFLTCS